MYKTLLSVQLFVSSRNMAQSSTCNGIGAPRKIGLRSRRHLLTNFINEPMMTRKELKIDLESSGTKVSERATSRELHGNGIESFTPRKTPMLTKKHVTSLSSLNFTNEHLEKGNEYWKTVIWSDETKIEPFGRNTARYGWKTKRTWYDRKNTIPTVKHVGGSIMVWAWDMEIWTNIGEKSYCEEFRVRSVYLKNASGRSNRTTTLSTL